MSHHGKGKRPCHLCDTETLPYHILTRHYHELHLEQESLFDSSKLTGMLSDLHLDCFYRNSKAFFINIIIFVKKIFIPIYRARMSYYDETLNFVVDPVPCGEISRAAFIRRDFEEIRYYNYVPLRLHVVSFMIMSLCKHIIRAYIIIEAVYARACPSL